MGGFGIGKCGIYGPLRRPESVLSSRRFYAEGVVKVSRGSGKSRRPGALPPDAQLMLVMVQPQRGHSEPCPERQVVPQWEQVDAAAGFPALAQPQA